MNTLHANFNGGLMSPKLAARFDLEKLATGAVQLENVLVSPYGGVFKRPGLEFVSATDTTVQPYRLIETRFLGWDRTLIGSRKVESEIMTMTGQWLRPIDNPRFQSTAAWVTATAYLIGDYVRVWDGVANTCYYCLEDHTSGANFAGDSSKWIATPASDVAGADADFDADYYIPLRFSVVNNAHDVRICQVNDVIFLAHESGPPMRLTPRASTALGSGFSYPWRMEPVPFEFAPALDVNDTSTQLQIQFVANDWVTATNYAVGDRVIGTDGQLYTCYSAHLSAAATAPITGANYLTVWNLGTSSETTPAWANATAYTVGDIVKRRKVIYECIANHTSSNPVATTFGFKGGNRPMDGTRAASFWRVYAGEWDLSNVQFKLVATDDTFASDDVGTFWRLAIGAEKQSVKFDFNNSTADQITEELFIQGEFTVTTNWAVAGAPIATLYLEESEDRLSWRTRRDWSIDTDDNNIAFTGDAGSTGLWLRLRGTVTTTKTKKYAQLEPVSSVVTIPFRIDSYTSATEVTGVPRLAGNQSPPLQVIGIATGNWRKPAFSPTEGWPRAVAFHDSRVWWAGTQKNQSRIWASQLDDFYNFLTGPNSTDGLDVTLASTRRNEIRWMTSFNRSLVIGTNLQEWTIDGGDDETTITPTTARARLRTSYGAGQLDPIVIEEAMLWVPKGNKKLLEFSYDFRTDGYTAPEMTQLLGPTEGTWVSMAFMNDPMPILWAVNSDGALYSFHYDRQQNIVAWAKHTTKMGGNATFKAVVCKTASSDQVYCVVKGNAGYGVYRLSISTDFYLQTDQSFNDGTTLVSWKYLDGHGRASTTAANSGANVNVTNPPTGAPAHVVQNRVPLNISPVFTATSSPHAIPNWQLISGSYIVGYAYTAKIQAFPLEVLLRDGTSQARNWRPNRVMFYLQNAYGGSYGDTPSDADTDIIYDTTPNPLFTGQTDDLHIESDFGQKTQFTIEHSDPTPFGLIGYVLKSEVSGS